jgi:acetyl esterase/lipase
MMRTAAILFCFVFIALAAVADSLPYEQKQDLVYGEMDGAGLLMDVFTPTGTKNGLGIVDIASGAWHSDRGKIRDHQMAQMYTIFCSKGYTVFAVRPGSRGRFTAEDMVRNVKTGIRWAKAHAADYGIDPDKLGLTGASAGGHLAALTVVTREDGDPKAKNPLNRFNTDVSAVGIFFPPTNFLQWGTGGMPDFKLIGDILFVGGVNGRTPEEIETKARAISPGLNVNTKTPPFLIWHGDADPLVPLQQSEFFVEKLKGVGTDVEFYVKAGGGHPWLTIPEEVAKMGDWFDTKLAGK